jgi:dTDP-4-dehydrorhamnose 3,5-epimerase
MIFHRTGIADALRVQLEPHADARGSFARAFCTRELAAQGVSMNIAQANLAHTHKAGVVRGLHYQQAPLEQKLVRCVAGAIFDVLVDLRPASPSYRQVHCMRLDAATREAIFIPGGVAHGYQALVDECEVLYLTDQHFVPGLDRGVRYDDPALAIPWPLPAREVNQRDREWPLL